MKENYILFVWHDVIPEIKGPYSSAEERDQSAKKLHADDKREENGIYKLDIDWEKHEISVDWYSVGFFEE